MESDNVSDLDTLLEYGFNFQPSPFVIIKKFLKPKITGNKLPPRIETLDCIIDHDASCFFDLDHDAMKDGLYFCELSAPKANCGWDSDGDPTTVNYPRSKSVIGTYSIYHKGGVDTIITEYRCCEDLVFEGPEMAVYSLARLLHHGALPRGVGDVDLSCNEKGL